MPRDATAIHYMEPGQERALELVMLGRKPKLICEELQISRQTLYDWQQLPLWGRRFQQERRELTEQTRGALRELIPRAIQAVAVQLVKGDGALALRFLELVGTFAPEVIQLFIAEKRNNADVLPPPIGYIRLPEPGEEDNGPANGGRSV